MIPRRITFASVVGVASCCAPATAQIAWSFRVESPRIDHRVAIGKGGRIYVQDSRGTLYALTREGSLLWSFPTGGQAEGPVALGPDGTIYVGANPAGPDVHLYAVNPDGSQRWVFTDTNTEGILAGPAVGPDGRIYLVTEAIVGFGGRGAIALNPTGSVSWSRVGDPMIVQDDGQGAEIAFGVLPEGGGVQQFYFAVDGSQRLYGFSLNGDQAFAAPIGSNSASSQFQSAAGPGGDVYLPSFLGVVGLQLRAYSPVTGQLRWSYSAPTPTPSEVDVGPDGTIYIGWNSVIDAINPDGSRLWRHNEAGLYNGPVVSPDNRLILAGGRITNGQAGYFKALDTSGDTLWRLDLPAEGGFNQVPGSRAKFSDDGARAYISTHFPGMPTTTAYAYLYALDTRAPCYADCDGVGPLTANDFQCFLNKFAAGDPYANCDNSTGIPVFTANDFQCFLNQFAAGCP